MSRSLILAPTLVAFTAAASLAQTVTAPRILVSGVDVPPPKRLKGVLPVYPPEAQARGVRGIVILEIVIDTAGKVASARLVRSIEGLDGAALDAVRKWEYEVTRMNGEPVSVRHTVPITFALKLPEIERQEGVPELRGGAMPRLPAGVPRTGRAEVKASLMIEPDGSVSDVEITKGEPPFSEELLRAVGTWRFAADPAGGVLTCRLVATFDLEAGKDAPVTLRLESPQRSEKVASPAEAATTLDATPEALPSAAPAASPAPMPEPTPQPAAGPPADKAPTAGPPPAEPPVATPPTATAPVAEPPAGAPTEPPAAPTAKPEAGSGTPSPERPAAAAAPPVEVVSRPPAAANVAEQGFSSVVDVTLGPGVPDLTKGRRPVVPPVARIQGTEGAVRVDFTIDAAGQTSIVRAEGTELLKAAAQQAVQSWTFRRTSPERLAVTAEFVYKGETATASVKPAQ